MVALLRYPLQAAALGVIGLVAVVAWVLYAVALTLEAIAPPLAYLTTPGWAALGYVFFQYCFAVLEDTALGRDKAPELTAELLTSFSFNPSLKLVLVAGVVYSLAVFLGLDEATPVSGIIIAVFVILVPGLIAVLALEGKLRRAVNPGALIGFIKAMGPSYATMLLVFGLTAMAVVWIHGSGLGFIVSVALTAYVLIGTAKTVGTLIYQKRARLGLGTVTSPEQRADLARAALIEDYKAVFDEIHRLSATGQIDQAWQELQRATASASHRLFAYEWFFEELKENEHERLGVLHGQHYIEALIKAGDRHRALEVSAWCLQVQPDFRATSSEHTFALARLAATEKRYRLAVELLDDFARHFPDDPRIPAATFLAATIYGEHLREPASARALLDWLAEHYREFARGEQFRRYRRLFDDLA